MPQQMPNKRLIRTSAVQHIPNNWSFVNDFDRMIKRL